MGPSLMWPVSRQVGLDVVLLCLYTREVLYVHVGLYLYRRGIEERILIEVEMGQEEN